MTLSQLPIIFSPHYDISLYGLENLHPFDTAKYGKVYAYLKDELGIAQERFIHPSPVTEEELLKVHSKQYLDSLGSSQVIAGIAELGMLAALPAALLQEKILLPMKYATGGTVLGVSLARQYGWAINLSGGYHHAKADRGSGFCFYADIPIAVTLFLAEDPGARILIIDLDAHQGNGHEAFFKDRPGIFIFDVYNKDIFPGDTEAGKFIDFAYPVPSGIGDQAYLALLKEALPKALETSRPDLIIYNAGTDIYEDDPLGAMKISEAGIMRRDEIVFKSALELEIPILMLLSGGYSPLSADIIAHSVENLFRNVLKVEL